MPTPAAIMSTSASLLNDTAQALFTNVAQLPYFNQALRDLQEQYEQNDVPVTYETSAEINIVAGSPGVTVVGFDTTPALPTDLIEIKRLWESPEDQDVWTPMGRRDFLPQQMVAEQINQFLIWAWVDGEIQLITANADIDIKMDYVKSLFISQDIGDVNNELGVKFNSCYSYLAFRTAALCSMYIGENPTRAAALMGDATKAMDMALSIATKGKQAIATRRLPFRFGFKRRGVSY